MVKAFRFMKRRPGMSPRAPNRGTRLNMAPLRRRAVVTSSRERQDAAQMTAASSFSRVLSPVGQTVDVTASDSTPSNAAASNVSANVSGRCPAHGEHT